MKIILIWWVIVVASADVSHLQQPYHYSNQNPAAGQLSVSKPLTNYVLEPLAIQQYAPSSEIQYLAPQPQLVEKPRITIQLLRQQKHITPDLQTDFQPSIEVQKYYTRELQLAENVRITVLPLQRGKGVLSLSNQYLPAQVPPVAQLRIEIPSNQYLSLQPQSAEKSTVEISQQQQLFSPEPEFTAAPSVIEPSLQNVPIPSEFDKQLNLVAKQQYLPPQPQSVRSQSDQESITIVSQEEYHNNKPQSVDEVKVEIPSLEQDLSHQLQSHEQPAVVRPVKQYNNSPQPQSVEQPKAAPSPRPGQQFIPVQPQSAGEVEVELPSLEQNLSHQLQSHEQSGEVPLQSTKQYNNSPQPQSVHQPTPIALPGRPQKSYEQPRVVPIKQYNNSPQPQSVQQQITLPGQQFIPLQPQSAGQFKVEIPPFQQSLSQQLQPHGQPRVQQRIKQYNSSPQPQPNAVPLSGQQFTPFPLQSSGQLRVATRPSLRYLPQPKSVVNSY